MSVLYFLIFFHGVAINEMMRGHKDLLSKGIPLFVTRNPALQVSEINGAKSAKFSVTNYFL